MISSSFTLYRNLNSEDTTTTILYVTYDTETDVPVPVHAALSSPSIDPISGAPTSTQVGWSKSGCELTKWATSRDGTGSSILPGEYPDISDSAFWGYVLYAVWEEPSIDYTVTSSELASVANAIRTKGGTSASLTFPNGFATAIAAIPTGTTPTGTINISANGTYDVTNYASAAVAIPEYAGAHHSVATEYTVTVSLTNPVSSGYFSSCTIYERLTGGSKGNQIGSISSASGSTTVSVDPSAYGLWIDLRGGYVVPNSDATMTGGVSNYDWNDGSTAYVTVSVSGDGTLTLDGIDWDD